MVSYGHFLLSGKIIFHPVLHLNNCKLERDVLNNSCIVRESVVLIPPCRWIVASKSSRASEIMVSLSCTCSVRELRVRSFVHKDTILECCSPSGRRSVTPTSSIWTINSLSSMYLFSILFVELQRLAFACFAVNSVRRRSFTAAIWNDSVLIRLCSM